MDSEAQPRKPAGDDDRPELLVKLQERRVRHQQRGRLARAGVVVLGSVLVLAGLVMSGPGVPGPGIATVLVGLTFLALEFDRAERLLERAIRWADAAGDRARNATRRQKTLTALAGVLAVVTALAVVLVWDVPLLPVLTITPSDAGPAP